MLDTDDVLLGNLDSDSIVTYLSSFNIKLEVLLLISLLFIYLFIYFTEYPISFGWTTKGSTNTQGVNGPHRTLQSTLTREKPHRYTSLSHLYSQLPSNKFLLLF